MNKKRILKGNEYHDKAISEITVTLINRHKIPERNAALLASSIPAGIMDYDEYGNLIMSSQLSNHMSGMSIGYKLGVDTGIEKTTGIVHKYLDSLGL